MVASTTQRPVRISIDRGGTFTDCIARVDGREDIIIKILSVDPRNYPDAPTEAIRQVLERFYGHEIPRGTHLNLDHVEWIRMGTTVATNALLERKGERTAFLVTSGFKDVLQIGNQSRPYMFDLAIRRPDPLYSEVFEVDERVVLESCTDSDLRTRKLTSPPALDVVTGTSGETVHVIKPIDVEGTRAYLQKLHDDGFRSVAVCLMHSYIFPAHEIEVGRLAREIGFDQITLSHNVSQRPKLVPRGNSAVVDGYLTPSIDQYLRQFAASFPYLDEQGATRLEFMQSDGGLVPASALRGLHSILSGPAGGVVGYSQTCYDQASKTPVIGFDMGGTSTDVSRFDGQLDHIFETTTAGISIHVPQLNVNTIAAGGGSILAWRDGLMSVGPESASSHPGPACYRKGGPLTVTDANLALGRLLPEHFPSVFGPDEDQPLDSEIVVTKFKDLTEVINRENNRSLSWTEVADGFLQVANSAMCGPIRSLTEARGHNTADHHLASFGGAGGQHACAIAEALGIRRVTIHKYSSILSAYGIGLADVVHEEERACAKAYSGDNVATVDSDLEALSQEARDHSSMQGFNHVDTQRFVSMRYDGSDTSIMVYLDDGVDAKKKFVDAHHQQFGFTPVNRDIFVDTIRVRAVAKSPSAEDPTKSANPPSAAVESGTLPKPTSVKSVYFNMVEWVDTPVYLFDQIPRGISVQGPALIVDETQTLIVSPSSSARIIDDKLIIDVSPPASKNVSSTVLDPVALSVFRHRFMGVAEQMGRVLQNVSVSANIKERLDFSCAIFTPEGSLVANAPHVPAMIGSMAFAVKGQIEHWSGKLRDGDVLLSNSPVAFGGTHLPDLTVVTPVFDTKGKEIIFWAASRGHHADVGGILPGSMPPNSKFLSEEGAVFDSFLLVRDGVFAEKELRRILCEEPANQPGCSGTRCFNDNMTDIKAQVGANHTGIRLVRQLIEEYTMEVVQVYMRAIQDSAELAVRNLFKKLAPRFQGSELSAIDYMDDGTPIQLKVTIKAEDGSALFDFSGTGAEVYGNWNAPVAICNSAVIYALRCMVDSDIPLNHGCIKPITIQIPDQSLLKPSHQAAVCAGNVLTSQRIVDVIFRAFRACAASQGCMNNFTFGFDGEDGFGYYETISGGSGAGPSWVGTSGVHTNMTNTRITDPESLERRYPVVLRRFCLRSGSGGDGALRGGDGVVRDVEFRMPMSASILSERRSFAPYGMAGGSEGQRGRNTWVQMSTGRRINIGGKNSVAVEAGDRVVIETPGGGGYGAAEDGRKVPADLSKTQPSFMAVAGGSVGAARDLAEQS
ncbi:Hydantoinase B/oxoprolinase [Geosmithia morbida]|uniref:Hydantoinase B/oxoprolinase n=1 Tax=Geosmithia morbida TaxID=1094350 RepID=A0A9P4Z4S5_9HYPO|nr:Hydantoinase B/oxoprolinase [Geosmithia morbida]KAF4126659.1 Hydantoinase B/oxoprolinase [Geosmithia morbida]